MKETNQTQLTNYTTTYFFYAPRPPAQYRASTLTPDLSLLPFGSRSLTTRLYNNSTYGRFCVFLGRTAGKNETHVLGEKRSFRIHFCLKILKYDYYTYLVIGWYVSSGSHFSQLTHTHRVFYILNFLIDIHSFVLWEQQQAQSKREGGRSSKTKPARDYCSSHVSRDAWMGGRCAKDHAILCRARCLLSGVSYVHARPDSRQKELRKRTAWAAATPFP